MAKFIRNGLIGIGLSAGAYMLINHKTPAALYRNIKSYVQDVLDAADEVQSARESLSDNSNNVSLEFSHAAEVFDDIQTEIDKFQFQIEPHLKLLKQHSDHLQATLDHLGQPKH